MSEVITPVSENAGGPTVLGDARERWLERRRQMVTASDVAAILGVDPRRTRLEVYSNKLGVRDEQYIAWREYGRDVEGAICKGFAYKTGRPIVDLGAHELQVHPDIPWLAATPDRMTAGCEKTPAPAEGEGTLEAKAVASFKHEDWEGDEGNGEPPTHFQIQSQIQMACTGKLWGTVVAMFGGVHIEHHDLLRDDSFLAAAFPILEAFREDVRLQRPPAPQPPVESVARALRMLYPKDKGTTVIVTPEMLPVIAEWEAAKADVDGAKERKELAAATLKLFLGDATWGALPDGRFLRWKVEARKEHVVKASEPRVLRITKSR